MISVTIDSSVLAFEPFTDKADKDLKNINQWVRNLEMVHKFENSGSITVNYMKDITSCLQKTKKTVPNNVRERYRILLNDLPEQEKKQCSPAGYRPILPGKNPLGEIGHIRKSKIA
jgi:hypothetical protein